MGHPRILRRPEVQARVGLSRASLYRFLRVGGFPLPLRLGPQAVGWLEEEIDAWIEQRRQERDARRLSAAALPSTR